MSPDTPAGHTVTRTLRRVSARMPASARRAALSAFRRLPRRARRFLVRSFTPNYTLGAVVLLRDAEDRLLLLRQPSAVGWSLPGGLLQRGEEPADAAARELAEETALLVESAALSPATPNAIVYPHAQQVDWVFTARLPHASPELVPDQAEVAEGRWCADAHLPALTAPTARLLANYGIGPGARVGEESAR